eukprot:365765-Chlamydomonas_euryale.AAC.8
MVPRRAQPERGDGRQVDARRRCGHPRPTRCSSSACQQPPLGTRAQGRGAGGRGGGPQGGHQGGAQGRDGGGTWPSGVGRPCGGRGRRWARTRARRRVTRYRHMHVARRGAATLIIRGECDRSWACPRPALQRQCSTN